VLGPVALAGTGLHGPVTVLVRPEDVAILADEAVAEGDRGSGDAGRVAVGRVASVDYLGPDSVLSIEVGDTVVRVRARDTLVRQHDEVSLRFLGPPAHSWPAA
jgi:hypothetical protein